ncbi:RsfA family transcriptional regulator [Thalassobacillus pellis]|uniref:RsfA family transcriptional regulator n=1 Tax=Thalassobacillus pellis TaxID=748008 RepID=UPI0019613E2A|nr:RsfA family transcriptional regulator [Thalassobacillus pellis]MBM7554659.1 prespore-specific regulator [Thalassobacillus pellis]
MTKVRQDAWSHEDDLLLAETVLRHIREGSTQLKAFDEVGDALNRTSAACGFRWNAEVRQKYDQAIEIAKKQRKEKKRAEAAEEPKKQTKKAYFPKTEPTFSHNSYSTTATDFSAGKEEEVKQDLDLQRVIQYLHQLQSSMTSNSNELTKLDKFAEENERLKQENERLEKQYVKLQNQLVTMKEDYQVLIQIMDRARKMIVFDEDGNPTKPQFRMERNGNLEQVAR